MPFLNRTQAGQELARSLESEVSATERPLVLGLARGGVMVAAEIAERLRAPLEVLVVRKIGAPGNPEYGIGAVTEDGFARINSRVISQMGIPDDDIRAAIQAGKEEVTHRVQLYRGQRPLALLRDRTAILVDDGLATGVTALAAVSWAKYQGARRVILAVPVCACDSFNLLTSEADKVICLEQPRNFYAVGEWYRDFSQVSDDEVIALLRKHSETGTSRQAMALAQALQDEVEITSPDGQVRLPGILSVPPERRGTVLFAHGSGSSRLSPRNQQVARSLQQAGIATLLFDLLSSEEADDRENVFDIPLLADRLLLATRWLRNQQGFSSEQLGFFGASTGAGAALWAASEPGNSISAVVSRGGRPDLALSRLPQVSAPTLLIVGEYDDVVIRLNEQALKWLPHAEMTLVPGATHLFEEPGTLEQAASRARDWFLRYLRQGKESAA